MSDRRALLRTLPAIDKLLATTLLTELTGTQPHLLIVEAPLACSQIALPYLRETHGSIVNIADIFGLARFRTHKKYSNTKAKLIEITREMAFEQAPHSVRVNAMGFSRKTCLPACRLAFVIG